VEWMDEAFRDEGVERSDPNNPQPGQAILLPVGWTFPADTSSPEEATTPAPCTQALHVVEEKANPWEAAQQRQNP